MCSIEMAADSSVHEDDYPAIDGTSRSLFDNRAFSQELLSNGI